MARGIRDGSPGDSGGRDRHRVNLEYPWVTFWQAYWRLALMMAKAIGFVAVSAAYGWTAGAALSISPWLSGAMMLALVPAILAFAAHRMTMRDKS